MTDRLPAEVTLSILQHIDSLDQLIRLTLASSTCYRIFIRHRKRILNSAIHPETLHHALAVRQLPQWHSSSSRQQQLPIVESFLDRYFERDPQLLPIPLEFSDLAALCHLVTQVSRLVDRYAATSIDALEGRDDPDAAKKPPLLSVNERVRFERAFLRYELYCKVFPPRDGRPEQSVFDGTQQNHLFLRHLKRWELEEICCIHQHLFILATEFIDDLEKYAADRQKADLNRGSHSSDSTDKTSQPPTPEENHHSAPTDREDSLNDTNDSDLIDLQVQSDHLFLRTKLNYLVSLGLDSVDPARTYNSDGTPRLDLIPEDCPTHRQFLPQAVHLPIRTAWTTVQESSQETEAEGDSYSRPNRAFTLFEWYMAGGARLNRIFSDYFYSWRGREMGHVFWDEERVMPEEVHNRLLNGWTLHPYDSRALARKALKVNVLMNCPPAGAEREIPSWMCRRP